MKKLGCIFFLQEVQKMFGILEKTTVKFSPKSEKKNIVTIFSIIVGLGFPLYPHFRRGLRTLYPLQGLLPPEPGWKTIDWNSNQLVLVYYWSTLLNQVRFRFIRFKKYFTSVFFHDSNHYLTFCPLWRRKRILFKKFRTAKNFLFRNS